MEKERELLNAVELLERNNIIDGREYTRLVIKISKKFNNSKALDETKTVNNNEQTKEVFYCRKGDGSHGLVSCETECLQCKFEREN